MRRIIRRLAVAVPLGMLMTLVVASAAFAHVTVKPESAPKGSYSELRFRVPNEREDAGTTKVEVHFPTQHPLASVRVQPVPGWEYQIEMTKLDQPVDTGHGQITEAVGKITWTGGPIKPGEYLDFPVSAGPLPENADQLVFKAIQTYESGEVVRWIQEASGDAEVEHPAPTLQLTAAEEGGHNAAAAPVEGTSATGGDGATAEDVDAASQRGTIGIVLGAIGLLLGAVALYLSIRRRGPGSLGEAG